jgi:uncharacterized membrane protein
MTDVPTQVILAAFKDEHGADAALEQLKAAQKEHLIDIRNAAVLRCDQEGKVHIKEPTDMGGGRGAVIGGVVGGLAGLLLGPVGWVAAGGAAIGGIAAKMRDSGFDDSRLRELAKSLQPGTSAILAVIDHVWVKELEAELQRAGADVVTQELSADIAESLKSGQDVAYTALVTDDAVITARVTADQPAGSASGASAAQAPAKAAPSETTPAAAAPGETTPAPAAVSSEGAEPRSA